MEISNDVGAIDTVLALDDQRLQAMRHGDAATLRNLLHPDLEYTHSDGRSDTLGSYLAALSGGALRYRRVERESAAASAHGPVVIVQGLLRLHALDQGQEKAIRIHYLANWVRDAGSVWRLRAWASTLVERLS